MDDELLDRDAELSQLEEKYELAAAGRPQFVMLWGRRRAGKTFLLSHFVNGKRSVFFGATQQAENVELARLAEAVARDLGRQTADLAGGQFASWEAALRFFVALAAQEPLVVVLDEVPYLAASTPGFASIVQAVWDHIAKPSRLLLVLSGSAFGSIESMIAAHGPLRGRPTWTKRLEPLSLLEARLFLPKLKAADLVQAYAACGGYPLHLQEWDQQASVDTNLLRLAMTAGGILLEDAQGILHEELPDGGYHRVMAAIGCGRSRFSEIASVAQQRIERPLDILHRANFVRHVLPLGAPKGANGLYELADVYLAFWFGVLYSEIPQIEAGQGQQVLKRVRPRFELQVSRVFEEAARDHARRLVAAGTLPEDLTVGRWWTQRGQPCEVDVLGVSGNSVQLLGEAKWRAKPLTLQDLHVFQRKMEAVPQRALRVTYALWGRGGVEPEVKAAGALGFSVDEMLEG